MAGGRYPPELAFTNAGNPSGAGGVRCHASAEVRPADHAGADEAPGRRAARPPGRNAAVGAARPTARTAMSSMRTPVARATICRAVDSASPMVRPCAGPVISRMWTVHQPPSLVMSISKLDIGPSLTRRSGSSLKSTRSAKRRFNDSSGHASRGRCGPAYFVPGNCEGCV